MFGIDKSKLEKIFKYVVIIYIVAYVLITLFSVKDYGWSFDDSSQRKHSLVAYKYINQVLFDRDLSGYETFANIKDIDKYGSKYYGTALQLPFVVIEDFFHFSLSTHNIYLIRHIGLALMCCLGYFFFYLFVKGVTNSRVYGFVGLMFISLYPRFYGEKFINIKDQLFVATCCLAYYGIYYYLSHNRDNKLHGIVAGATFAIATWSRSVGIMFPIMLVGYLVVLDIMERKYSLNKVNVGNRVRIPSVVNSILDYLIIGASYVAVWYIGSPVAWGNGAVKNLGSSVTYFSNYDKWDGTSLFNGAALSFKETPWYYIFVWIGITVPIIYLILFIIGHVNIYRKGENLAAWFRRMMTEDKYLSLSLAMFWGPCALVALHKIKIYTAWRHMFFLMCPLVLLAVFGLKWVLETFGKKRIVSGAVVYVLSVAMLLQINWMINNHPYEYAYFNVIGRPIADQFDRDYFRACAYDLIRYVLDNDSRDHIVIESQNNSFDLQLSYLTDEEKSRVEAVGAHGDYAIQCYRGIAGDDYCPIGYHEVYSIVIDGYKIGSVFRSDFMGIEEAMGDYYYAFLESIMGE